VFSCLLSPADRFVRMTSSTRTRVSTTNTVSTSTKRYGVSPARTTRATPQIQNSPAKVRYCLTVIIVLTCGSDIPPRTPSKKHDDERETTKRDREPPASPVLKKAGVTMHPRSKRLFLHVRAGLTSICRTVNIIGRYVNDTRQWFEHSTCVTQRNHHQIRTSRKHPWRVW
jgi:hypothetical protein